MQTVSSNWTWTHREPPASLGLPWRYHDGGRRASGRRGLVNDCVVRAIAIATGVDYDAIWREIAIGNKHFGRRLSADHGCPRTVYELPLLALGWKWTPAMEFGKGCRVHLRPRELPENQGALICKVSGHLTAVVDGIVYDTMDPCRNGRRCVYGWWSWRV